jgi:hypothetical protein
MVKFNCKICEKEISQDRYNVKLEYERQDFPGESDWTKSVLYPQENVCSSCFGKIEKHFKDYCRVLKLNKGYL